MREMRYQSNKSQQTEQKYQTPEEEMYTKACNSNKTKIENKESLENLIA